MKTTMYKTITLLLALVLGMQVHAQSAVNVEEELERAQAALEEAAKKIAELHAQKHSGMHGNQAKRAMLGILIGEKVDGGVDVHGITPKSGAAEAGLEAGDKIVVIDGIDLSVRDDPYMTLSKHMKTVSPGDDVAITYIRGDERASTVVTTQARSVHVWKMLDGMDFDFDFNFDKEMEDISAGFKTIKELNAYSRNLMYVEGDLADYFDIEQGVVVIEPSEGSDLKAGDVLLSIAGEEVDSVAMALKLSKGAEDEQDARVKRDGRDRDVKVRAGELKGGMHQEVKVIRIDKDKD